MIEILLRSVNRSKRICVRLDPHHPSYGVVYVMVRGLLSAYEVESNVWTISYNDMAILRHRLDLSRLIEGRTIEEDAFEWISWIHSQRMRNEEIKKGVNNEHVRALLQDKLKTTLYEDQLAAVAFALHNRRVGIFDEMGVGKTLQMLATVVALGDGVKRTLVVCPYTVQMGFTKEILKHTHLKPLSVPSGKKLALDFVKKNRETDWDVMLVHPENLVATGRKSAWAGDILKVLLSMQWDMIGVDEFHMYKNLEAKRTRCVLSLLTDCRDRVNKRPRGILMTGTPVSETPLNAYVALRTLSMDIIPHINKFQNHFELRKDVSIPRKRTDGKKGVEFIKVNKVVGNKNLDELRGLLESVSIRRTKDEMTGFPDRVLVVRDVELRGKQKTLYKAICGELVNGLSKSSEINIEKFLADELKGLRLRQLLNSPALIGERGDSAKHLECDAILDEVLADPEAKVVLWTEFRHGVELLHKRYDKLYGAVKIYGGVSNKQLVKIAQKFEHEDSPRVAVCIPAKAGTGVDFLARARTAVYVDRPYSYTLFKQSLERIHRRVVQEAQQSKLDTIRAKPATMIFLDVVNSIDELVRSQLLEKERMATALTTGRDKLVALGRQDLLHYLAR